MGRLQNSGKDDQDIDKESGKVKWKSRGGKQETSKQIVKTSLDIQKRKRLVKVNECLLETEAGDIEMGNKEMAEK